MKELRGNMFIYSFSDIPKFSKICIYGIGPLEQSFVKLVQKIIKDIEIVCFIDTTQIGEIENIKVIKIDEFINSNLEYDCIYIRSSVNQKIELLNKFGITNYKLLDPELTNTCQNYFKEIGRYNYINDDLYTQLKNNFKQVENILKYNEDKDLYRNLINFRRDPEKFEDAKKYFEKNLFTLGNQYLDYINISKIQTMIEGGVCNAASSYKFQDVLPNLNKLFGFEPFEKFYNTSLYFDLFDKNKINIVPLALWYEKTKLKFEDNGGASHVSNNGKNLIEIESTSIDEFVKENNVKKIDYIKLDTEGSELNILKGGINTLIKDRPQLAISIYHSLNDMYAIPIFLNEVLENYTFRLGHYSVTFTETVFYAIPSEKLNQ